MPLSVSQPKLKSKKGIDQELKRVNKKITRAPQERRGPGGGRIGVHTKGQGKSLHRSKGRKVRVKRWLIFREAEDFERKRGAVKIFWGLGGKRQHEEAKHNGRDSLKKES